MVTLERATSLVVVEQRLQHREEEAEGGGVMSENGAVTGSGSGERTVLVRQN